jgi:hypothetical protein
LQDRTDNPLRSSKRLTKHSVRSCDRAACRECVAAAILRSRSILGTISSSRCQITRISRLPRGTCPRVHHAMKHELFFTDEPDPDWWSQTGSNRRPPACKAGALPAELWPLTVAKLVLERPPSSVRLGLPTEARGKQPWLRPSGFAGQPSLATASVGWWAWEDLNFRPHAYQARALTN